MPGTPARGMLAGIGLYLAALAMFASMDAATKSLVGSLPVVQVMWARFGFHLLVVALGMRLLGLRPAWRPRAMRLQVGRSLLLCLCNLLFASALLFVKLGQTTAISFVGPVVTTALAALWLRETVGWRRWSGVALGLAGVLVMFRPGFGGGGGRFDPALLLPLGSATAFAGYAVLTRRAAALDRPATTILHTALWAMLVTSCAVPFVWVWPDRHDWTVMLALGALGGGGHGLLVLAYARAPASLLAPMSYVQLVAAVLYGYFLFAEVPDLATILGAVVIAAGGLLALSGGTGAAESMPAPPSGAASGPGRNGVISAR